jgi:hypothetical protein
MISRNKINLTYIMKFMGFEVVGFVGDMDYSNLPIQEFVIFI